MLLEETQSPLQYSKEDYYLSFVQFKATYTIYVYSSSHLNEHKFRHNFQDCLNPLCSCSLEIEDTVH